MSMTNVQILANLVSGENFLPSLQTAVFPLSLPGLFSFLCGEEAGFLVSFPMKTLILPDQGPILITSFKLTYFFSKYGLIGH